MMNLYKQSLLRLKTAGRLTEAMLNAAVGKGWITADEKAEIAQ